MTLDVSILIPAYAASGFIDRTLHFARGQTHLAVCILVSVDKSDDATLARVRAHVDQDARVTLFAQEQRRGWAGNVNFLLDRVVTPFFFLYFHDDIIVPHYTEKLLGALTAAPHAVSVHCDMGHFGGSEEISIGRPYLGSAAARLMTFLLAPYRGSPLRSLMRTDAAKRLRLLDGESGGIWANEPFLMEMLAVGPALHVAETLYLRWDQRRGGLTDAWRGLTPEAVLASYKVNLLHAIEIADRAARDDDERNALIFAHYLNLLSRVQLLEHGAGRLLFHAPEELHTRFANLAPPDSLASFGPEIAAWADARWSVARDDLHARRAA